MTVFPNQPPRLIMLDLDGTLVDSVPDLAMAIDNMLNAIGKPPAGESKVRTWVGNGAHALVARAFVDSMTYPDALNEREDFQRAYRLFFDYYEKSNGEAAVVYPGVHEALKRWQSKGIKLAIVTNKPMQFTTSLIERVGIAHYFDWISGGDSLPKRKPEPDQLLHILQLSGEEALHALMVGDSSNDIKAARAANVCSLAVPYGYNHGQSIEDSHPDQIVNRLDEFHH